MPRTEWVDNVRGVAIALVVIGHTVQYGAQNDFYGVQNDFDFFSNPVFDVIYAFHMPLFAFVSGYLAFSSFARRSGSTNVRSRVRSLLLPFVAWTLVGGTLLSIAIHLVLGDFSVMAVARDVVRSFVFPGASLWFLWFLFVCYALVALTLWAQKYIRWAAFPLVVVLVFLIPLGGILSTYQVQWLYPFFLAGYALHNWQGKLRRFESLATIVSLALFVSLIWLWDRDDSVYVSEMKPVNNDALQTAIAWGYRYLIALAGVIAVIGIVRLLSRRWSMPLLSRIGVQTLGIYAVQTYLVQALIVIPSPAKDPALYFAVYVPLVSLAILTAAYLATTLVLQRVRILRVLFLGGPSATRLAQSAPVTATLNSPAASASDPERGR